VDVVVVVLVVVVVVVLVVVLVVRFEGCYMKKSDEDV